MIWLIYLTRNQLLVTFRRIYASYLYKSSSFKLVVMIFVLVKKISRLPIVLNNYVEDISVIFFMP